MESHSVNDDDFIQREVERIRDLVDAIDGTFYEVPTSTCRRKQNVDVRNSFLSTIQAFGTSQVKQQRKANSRQWRLILDELELNDGKLENCRRILECKFERIVTVMKDIPPPPTDEGDHNVHRTYRAKDTLLDKMLRRMPPSTVLDRLATISRTFQVSQKLFNIVEETTLADDTWNEFMMEFNKMSRKKTVGGYALNTHQIRRVFLIRHTWREDTILSLCARRNPPLRVIESISNICRESVCVVDCKRWDWIPMQYAIAYHARPEVVEALIPTKEDRLIECSHCDYHYCAPHIDCEEKSESGGFDSGIGINDISDVLFRPDYHYRTPLHWAAYYDAPLETIEALKSACSKEVLLVKDHCGHEPYKTAIWHGRSSMIIKAFFAQGLTYKNFEDILVKLIRSLIYKKEEPVEGSGGNPAQDGTYTFEHFDLDSISAHIANSPSLQKILGMKSCDPLPTVVVVADFYSCILLIISYHISSRNFLTGKDPTTSAWFGVLALSIGWIALRELAQIFVEHVRWFLSLWNYLDIAIIAFVVKSFVEMWVRGADKGESSTTLIVITTALVWLNAIFFLRSTFMPFATFVGGIFKIITDLIPFIVISALILMAFGEMFSVDILGERGECRVEDTFDVSTDFCSFQDSIFITYGLFVEGIDLDFYANADTRMKSISMVFGFLVTIILLNVVIVIVGNSWNGVVLHSKQVFWAYRLAFLIEVKGYESLLYLSNQGGLQKILQYLDCRLSDLCKIFWPSNRYWGNFDSIFDRIFTDKIGSLRWQCIYESRTTWFNRILIGIKVAILLFIFGAISAAWFILGLVSFGLLWPLPIKLFMLASAVEKDQPASIRPTVASTIDIPMANPGIGRQSRPIINHKPFTPASSYYVRPSTAGTQRSANSTNNTARITTTANNSSIIRDNLRSTIDELTQLMDQIPDDDDDTIVNGNLDANANNQDDLSYATRGGSIFGFA